MDALASNSTGPFNTATGAFALFHNTTGNSNTANGTGALQNNSTGSGNTSAGSGALTNNTSGDQNTANGVGALSSNTSGSNNNASGAEALAFNTTGSSNSASGEGALVGNTTGGQNTASGTFALFNNTTGSFNTALGFQAGPDSRSTNLTNSTAIGANATVTASNAIVLGSINGVNGATADALVGIGITAPTHKFHVGPGNNSFRVEGPPQGTTSPIVASFGGTGDFRIDAVNVGGGRFLVKDNGFVGINTTAPDATLSVNGSADKPGGGSWATFSDRRLKTLDGNFDAGLSQVLKLHPIRYRYKKDNALGIQDHEEHVGFVAQDVQKVIPEAVTENSKGYLLVNNDPILWTMLNAIQEQQREIATLRKQLRQRAAKQVMLESRLVRLEHDREEKTKVALARQTR